MLRIIMVTTTVVGIAAIDVDDAGRMSDVIPPPSKGGG